MTSESVRISRAVSAYADELVALLDGPGVCSPLGAWLLLALAAEQAEEADRVALEQVVGVSADESAAAAGRLLADPPDAVRAAAALWADPDRLADSFAAWRTPDPVERAPLPTPAEADRWAAERTDGLISTFPLAITPLSRIVLTSALATRITWAAPLHDLGDGWLGTDDVLAEHAIVETDAAGPVAVVLPRSGSGLAVLSVIADPAVAPVAVLRAAHEVAGRLAEEGLRSVDVVADGHAWSLTERHERRAVFAEIVQEWSARVPRWRLTSEHDLGTAPGFPTAIGSLLRHVSAAEQPAEGEAIQSAVAAYTAEGFEAAAISAIGVRAAGLVQPRDVVVREIEVTLDRPHAVVAVVADPDLPPDSPWPGVPVFSAWVDPDERSTTPAHRPRG